jgi:hypothetical protein
MPQHDIVASKRSDHRGGNFSREGPFRFQTNVLCTNFDSSSFELRDRCGEVGKGREDDDFGHVIIAVIHEVAGFSFQFPAMMGVRLLTPLANEEESSYQIEVSSSGRG